MQKNKNEELNLSELKLNKNEKNYSETYTYKKLSIRIAMSSIFAALAIGASYVLAPLINIEIMSFLLFLAGFLYGKYIGLFVGLISSTIYYGWNPFGTPPLPLYITCIACMVFIGFIGGMLKLSSEQEYKIEITKSNICKFALIGLFYTILFSIVTNIVYAYFYYGGDVILAFITGLPFIIIHLTSNTIIFAFLTIPIYNTVVSIR